MKRLIIGLLLVASTSLALLAGCHGSKDDATTGNIQMEVTINGMEVTINGLERGDEAVLCLSFETATTAEGLLLEQNVESDGKSITVDLRTSLEDGYYQLLLEAPDEYFRDPKGYFFQVYQSQIVNPTGRSIVFDLTSPSALNMLERMISLSAPEKEGEPNRP